MPPLRPCLDCGKPSPGNRCPQHQAQREAARPERPTSQDRDDAERARRAAAVAAHRRTYGEWCPGWRARAAHPVYAPNDLTADHEVAVAAGGDPHGRLVVRCRVCNGAKGARPA